MDQSPRKKRPTPERTSPRRSWFSDAAAPAEPDAPGDARAESAEHAPDARETSYRAINNAYQLIDEYMRQGQKMAENLWVPLGGGESGAAAAFNAPERLMRAMGDMTMAWMEVMQQVTLGAQSAQPGKAKAAPFSAGRGVPRNPNQTTKPGAREAPAGLTVNVSSAGRVEVSVQLNDFSDIANLVPTPLRPFQGDASAIADVRLEVREAEAVMHVVVPDGQPPGVYNGLLLTRDTQRPKGTINLVVGELER